MRKDFVQHIMIEYLKNEKTECLIQYNGRDCCTGFYSMKPSENTKNINYSFFKSNNYMLYLHDQDFFNTKIFIPKLINIQFLERSEYPNGSYYYQHQNRIDGSSCYLIHFNCLIGYENKINTMKKYNHWYIK